MLGESTGREPKQGLKDQDFLEKVFSKLRLEESIDSDQ